MQNIPKRNSPKCNVISFHEVLIILFKLNLTSLEIYDVIVKQSLCKTENYSLNSLNDILCLNVISCLKDQKIKKSSEVPI